MMTVSQARDQGWIVVEKHLASDNNVALMKHQNKSGVWEFGFAIWSQRTAPARQAHRYER